MNALVDQVPTGRWRRPPGFLGALIALFHQLMKVRDEVTEHQTACRIDGEALGVARLGSNPGLIGEQGASSWTNAVARAVKPPVRA